MFPSVFRFVLLVYDDLIPVQMKRNRWCYGWVYKAAATSPSYKEEAVALIRRDGQINKKINKYIFFFFFFNKFIYFLRINEFSVL